VSAAAREARARGELPAVALPDVAVERPQRPEHGDYATSLALRLARSARANPLTLAEALVRHLPASEAVGEVSVAAPGFVNFRLSESWLARQVDAVLAAGDRFGDLDIGGDQTVQVEFVSANPTGPLHVGNGRGAAIGATLAAVLEAAGYRVEREYYFNDAGSQIDALTRSVYARYQQLLGREAPFPEDGYPGRYVVDIAEAVKEEHGDRFLRPEGEPAPEEIGRLAVQRIMDEIRHDLEDLGLTYDVWFNERSLYEPAGPEGRSLYEQVMALLRERGFIAEKEGAIWFAPSARGIPTGEGALGEEKDNVLVRGSGEPTYFASDVAYHYDKFLRRRFHRVINVWGADHQGHVARMKAAVAALGVDPERLDLLIYQLVTLKRGAEVVRLSKRGGEIVTVRDVIDEVGPDACRFFFLARSADAPMDFDLELAKRQSAENPVYYVQYAHARISGILRHAAERSLDYASAEGGSASGGDGDVSLLTHPAELALVRKMLLLPELLESIAGNLEPHHLPHYAQDLATAFHDFYEKCRVVSDDVPLSKARLKLVAACRLALARTLGLIGVSAPQRM
jgi:arginyl-tRNA synthetase